MVTAGRMRRPSSPFSSVEPRPGRYIAAQSATKIRRALRRVTAGFCAIVSLSATVLVAAVAEDLPPPKGERVLLCVWDGMRPDFITPELTPNLYALAQRGTFFANNHSSYPTTTEVNGA